MVTLRVGMSFDLEDFIDNPSFEKLDSCRKDDLLCIAAHFDIFVQKYGERKSKIRCWKN